MAITTVADLRRLVRGNVPDRSTPVLPDPALDTQLTLGLNRLSRDRPDVATVKISDLTLEDDAYILSKAPGWVRGFSGLKGIFQNSLQPPLINRVPTALYTETETPDGKLLLMLRRHAEVDLLTYSIPWKLDGLDSATETTLSPIYDNALVMIASSFLCRRLATEAAGRTSTAVRGDRINYDQESRRYHESAAAYRVLYNEEIGISRTAAPAAATAIQRQRTLSTGEPYLTHRGI